MCELWLSEQVGDCLHVHFLGRHVSRQAALTAASLHGSGRYTVSDPAGMVLAKLRIARRQAGSLRAAA